MFEALNDVWDASNNKCGPQFIPDHLFPKLDGSGVILEPMSYARPSLAFDSISVRFQALGIVLSDIPSIQLKPLRCHGHVN